MSAVILLSLPLSLLIVGSLMGWALLDAIRHAHSPANLGASSRFVPAGMAVSVETAATLEGLVGERWMRKTQVMDVICPEEPFMPQVTEPEVHAIATELRRQGPTEIRRVLDRSRTTDGICPMRLASGHCACSLIRPLNCLGRCRVGGDSPEWATGLGRTISTAFGQHLENHHERGTTRGLNEALLTVLDSPTS